MKRALVAAVLLAACGGGAAKPWTYRVSPDYSAEGARLVLTREHTCEVETMPTGGEIAADGEITEPTWSDEVPCDVGAAPGRALDAQVGKRPVFRLGTTDASGALTLTWAELAPLLEGDTAYVLLDGKPVGLLEWRRDRPTDR